MHTGASSLRFCYNARMVRVYSEPSPVFIYHLRDLLEGKGIAVIIRNELLAGGVGELPPTEVWPELWVVEKEDSQVAEKIVRDFITSTKTRTQDWVCSRCGEHIEGQFAACWNCGSGRNTS